MRLTQLRLARIVPNPDMDFQPHRMHRLEFMACMGLLINKLPLQDFKVNADHRKANMQIQELR
jgi:hypothetical protein